MIKRTLILAALVCAMAGEMYASNTETQVVNPQPESVRILQEQVCVTPLQLSTEQESGIDIDIEISVTVNGKTYTIEIHIHKSSSMMHFEMTVTSEDNQTATVVGSAPYSSNLTGDDVTATIEGVIDNFNMDVVAQILNIVISNVEE